MTEELNTAGKAGELFFGKKTIRNNSRGDVSRTLRVQGRGDSGHDYAVGKVLKDIIEQKFYFVKNNIYLSNNRGLLSKQLI